MPKVRNPEWTDWKDTGQKVSMGEQVGRILQNLKDTACVHVQQREQIAIMRMYALLFPEDVKFIKYLNESAIPAFKELGYGRWYRDVITDLALALAGKQQDTKSVESVKNIVGKK